MTTRFLLTCISAYYYDGEHTLDDLHEAIAEDATNLYSSGVTVSALQLMIVLVLATPYCIYMVTSIHMYSHIQKSDPYQLAKVQGTTLHFILLGCKGDWPYLRKALLKDQC